MDTSPAPKQSYQPNKRTIGELLAMTSPSIIVPDWQRNYSWQSTNIDTFWNDILLFERRSGAEISGEYFLGSLVLVNSSGKLLLLDGQQRLATSTILLSVIRDRLATFNMDAANQIQNNFLTSYDFAKKKEINKLRLNIYDKEYFKRLILEKRDSSYVEPQPEIGSHYLIKSARDYFSGVFSKKYLDLPPEKAFEWALRIQNILTNHMTVISVTSDDEDSAAEVFETLNDRGIGLSTPDLLRNLVIRRADEGQQEEIVELWGNVISFQSDGAVKNFLRHYWVSHYGDVKSQSLYREIKATILEKGISSAALSKSMSDSASLYRDLIKAEVDDEECSNMLESVQAFGAGSGIMFPAILSIFEALTEKQQQKALNALINVFVRDGLIGQRENSVLENRFHSAARLLRENNDLTDFCSRINQGALDDQEVEQAFKRLSMNHNGARRYILFKIEQSTRGTAELTVNAPSKVHVEHVYPQTPDVVDRWQNHDRQVNRIGNLSLLDGRLNSTIKNGPFEAKKSYYAKSEINITNALASLDAWDEAAITTRQNKFAELAPSIWPLIN